MISLSA